MIFFIKKTGDIIANTLKTYKLSNFRLTNSNNQSITNSINYDQEFV